ncbi:MAG TPA: PIG-L family deacetylase [Thermoanaerobaculia bacterium]|nr:PIG-L family deacetylase [Thermoanaerobaculia bacterium]
MATIFWLAVLLLGLAHAEPVSGRSPLRRPPPLLPGTTSVLWVGAHPDDESLVAPLLGRLCIDEGLRCSFLVLTHGEQGPCLLPHGCKPDLATVRTSEMIRAAKLFGAQLVLWNFPDGGGAPDGSAPSWDATAGGHAALISSLSSFIAATGADLVLTFDPRHGSTCHADHRATGNLVVESLSQIQRSPVLYFLETRLIRNDSPFSLRFAAAAPAAAGVFAFDANANLLSTGLPAWQTLVQDLLAHPSQFDAPVLRAIRSTIPQERAVFLGHAALLLASPELVESCQ